MEAVRALPTAKPATGMAEAFSEPALPRANVPTPHVFRSCPGSLASTHAGQALGRIEIHGVANGAASGFAGLPAPFPSAAVGQASFLCQSPSFSPSSSMPPSRIPLTFVGESAAGGVCASSFPVLPADRVQCHVDRGGRGQMHSNRAGALFSTH